MDEDDSFLANEFDGSENFSSSEEEGNLDDFGQHPPVQHQQQRQQQAPPRPWDEWVSNGPAVDPPPFEFEPQIRNGLRTSVRCRGWLFDQQQEGQDANPNNTVTLLNHVLMTKPAELAQIAYVRVPDKTPIRTIMGEVHICVVLQRCDPDDEDSDNEYDDDDDDASASMEGEEEQYDEDEIEDAIADDADVLFEVIMPLKHVAIKVNLWERMQQLQPYLNEDPWKEIKAMQLVGRSGAQHVMGCEEVIFDEGAGPGTETLNVVMRYCRQGDMFGLLQEVQSLRQKSTDTAAETRAGLPEAQAKYWILQVARGLHELHLLGICHRDLSPENIMMDAQRSLVIDLGLCIRIPYREEQALQNSQEAILASIPRRSGWRKLLTNPQGTVGKLPYMSWEIFRNTDPFDGPACDVWALGTILFCMLTGTRSYHTPGDAMFQLMSSNLGGLFQNWNVLVSPQCLHLLRGMLTVDPRLRLTLDEVLQHEWFRSAPR